MTLAEGLMWVFAGLFLLSGLPLLFFDRDHPGPAGQLLAGTATLSLGLFGICLAWSAWQSGVINLQHFNYSRAGQPRRFMATLAVILLAGCGTIVAAFWYLFFKS
jgi:hypothetical protein